MILLSCIGFSLALVFVLIAFISHEYANIVPAVIFAIFGLSAILASKSIKRSRNSIEPSFTPTTSKFPLESVAEPSGETVRSQKRDQKEAETLSAIAECPGSEQYRLEKHESEANSSLLSVTAFTPISKKRFVAFDLETTGLDAGGDMIIEIGAVRVEDGEITAEYQTLVNPERHVPDAATAVNHITDDMLVGCPKIHQALPAFLAFVGDDVLAAHNARFDASFIQQVCMRNRFRVPAQFFDTMSLARYWPEAENKKLETLISAAGIENDEAHRALGDARAVARLILATNEKRKASRKSASNKS